MEAHHILPVRAGGSDDVENGEAACTTCHRAYFPQEREPPAKPAADDE
jgi:5-methylcytosine-specific restriction endonuclease McrA